MHTFPAAAFGDGLFPTMRKVMVKTYGLVVAVSRCTAFQPSRHLDGERSAALLTLRLSLALILWPGDFSLRPVMTGITCPLDGSATAIWQRLQQM